MGLQRMLAPHARHHHVRHPEVLAQLACAPVSRAVRRLALDGPVQDARFQPWRERAGRLTRVAREKPSQLLLYKALAPAIDKRVIAVELAADRGPGVAGGEQQDQSCPSCVIRSTGATVGSASQFHAFGIRQGDRANEHDHTSRLPVTDH